MMIWVLPTIGWIVLVVWMAALWCVHRRIRNAGIVDVGWAAGLAFLGVLYAAYGSGDATRRSLIGAMAFFWGARLAWHLFFDRVLHKPEDSRYAALRAEWNDTQGFKFFWFFQFQGVLDVILSIPFLLAAMNPATGLSLLEWSGMTLWAIALSGESLADSQLKRFKKNPANKGKTCRAGLWRYSRHPNYFFEWLIWVAYFLFALASPWGWLSILCPVLMLYFLLRVTGIPMTEQQSLKSRGDEFRAYQQTTSMFVPWFPKKGQS